MQLTADQINGLVEVSDRLIDAASAAKRLCPHLAGVDAGERMERDLVRVLSKYTGARCDAAEVQVRAVRVLETVSMWALDRRRPETETLLEYAVRREVAPFDD